MANHDQILTPEVIAMVEPMCDKALELSNEAQKLGGFNALDVYANKWDVFAALNPSLQAALDEAGRPWKRSA